MNPTSKPSRAEGVKLTAAQRKLLALTGQGEVDVSWGHPEAKFLGAAGLVTIRHCVPASTFVGGQVIKITPAGRQALEASR